MQTEDIVQKQKATADFVIKKLRAIDHFCIVAGGAPRDWYFGNSASDIDIYVRTYTGLTPSNNKQQLEALGFVVSKVGKLSETDEYCTNPNVKAVFDLHGLDYKVQVVFINISTFDLLDTFSLSICKAWYTPERGVCPEYDFKISVKTKIIFRTGKLYAASEEYLSKIKSKFKDYSYSEEENIKLS